MITSGMRMPWGIDDTLWAYSFLLKALTAADVLD
jgi:hypothetical protein